MELDSANSVSYSKQSSISLPGCPGDEFVVEFEEYTCQLCKGSTHKQAGIWWPRDHGEISNKYPAVMIFVFLAPFFSHARAPHLAEILHPQIVSHQILATTSSPYNQEPVLGEAIRSLQPKPPVT